MPQKNYVNLNIDQGADFNVEMDLAQDDGTPVDLTGCQLESNFKQSFYSANVSGYLQISIINAVNGNAIISIDAANTSNVEAGTYVYDVYLIDANSIKMRVLEGKLSIAPRVTV